MEPKILDWRNLRILDIQIRSSIFGAIQELSNVKLSQIISVNQPSVTVIRCQVNEDLNLIPLPANNMSKKLLVIFESTIVQQANYKTLNWINFQSSIISHLQLNYSTAMNEFIIEFITESLAHQLDVFFNHSSQYVLTTFYNSSNFNLLMYASYRNNQEILKELLKMPFDINQKNDLGQTAADLALLHGHFDILCLLLENNSTFPREFDRNPEVKSHKEIKKFVKISESLHKAIEAGNETKVIKILDQNQNLIHFYNFLIQSAATFSLNNKRFQFYKLLAARNILPSQDENFDSILGNLSQDEKKEIRLIHSELAKESEPHIASILKCCKVCHDDQDISQRYLLILELLKDINELSFTLTDGSKVPFGNYLLRLIAAHGNFQIFFDFNRTSVQHMDPVFGKAGTQGECYPDGNIFIAAKELLDGQTRHKTVGVTTHELCHFANLIIFNNSAKPYGKDDSVKEKEFDDIIESYKTMRHEEDIVSSVFNPECYKNKITWPAELIVRAPHMIAHYHKNPTKLSDLRKTYEKLFKYFEEFFTQKLIETLEILEKLSKNDSTVTFSKLTEPLKDKILQVEVEFQGKTGQLNQMVQKSSENVLNHLKPSEMLEMINKTKKEIKVGKIVEIKKEDQEIYIEREFIDFEFDINERIMTFDGNWEEEVLDNKKSFEEIVSQASMSKLFLLSDEAGAGKSTSFKHICVKLKEEFPNNWISYVDLKKYLKVYEKYSRNEEWQNETVDVKILTEVLKEILEIENDFDFAIFKHFFKLSQVILLLDGVDEIAPIFKKFFINLVLKIRKSSENQVWIATRPHHTKELKQKLDIEKSFKHLLWNRIQQKKFIENILKIKNVNEHQTLKMAIDIYISILNVLDIEDLSNPFLLKMFTESYLIDGKIDNSNLFSLYQKVVESKIEILNKEKGEIANANRDNQSTISIWEIHQVYALKTIFITGKIKFFDSDIKISLPDLSILQKWENEKSKWSPEKISRYGFLYVDNWDSENEPCEFIHRTVAEFFVAQFLIDNFYEFGNQDLSFEEAERRLIMLVVISYYDEIVLTFIESYLETVKDVKKLNEQFLKCLQSDLDKKFFEPDSFRDPFSVFKCFWRHPEVFKLLMLHKNVEKKLFRKFLLIEGLKFKFVDSFFDFINLIEKCFSVDWIDFTGYKKINQNENFQHLTQAELEKYAKSDNIKKKTKQKGLLKVLNFIPQMQISEEDLEMFLEIHLRIIASYYDENFLKSEIYKKFKNHIKMKCQNLQKFFFALYYDGKHFRDIFSSDIKAIKFFEDFLSPEFDFLNDFFANNTLDPKFNPLIESILFEDSHFIFEFCKEKFSKRKIQEILSENLFTLIFYKKQDEDFYLEPDLYHLKKMLNEYFPSDMSESEKKLLNRMLTKKNPILDDENAEEKLFGLSIMDFLTNEIKKIEIYINTEDDFVRQSAEENLECLHSLQNIFKKFII